MKSEILQPIVALAAWTMLMWLWMYATRIPAMRAAKVDAAEKVGGTGKDLDGVLPEKTQWIAHNYNHLHEAPTIFYAVIVFLQLSGGSTDLTRGLAWAYVVLRIVHSLWQSTVNRIPVRFAIFSVATLCLLALSLLAVIATLG